MPTLSARRQRSRLRYTSWSARCASGLALPGQLHLLPCRTGGAVVGCMPWGGRRAVWLRQPQARKAHFIALVTDLHAPVHPSSPSLSADQSHSKFELFLFLMQDYLSPWEQQLAEQINAMNLPVHVEVRFRWLLLLRSCCVAGGWQERELINV